MFFQLFHKGEKIKNIIDRFYTSPFYIFLIALLTFASEIFGLETPVYILYVLLGVIFPALFCHDMRGIIPPLFFGYFSASLKHSQGDQAILLFSGMRKTVMIVLIVLIFVFLFLRLIFDLIKGKKLFLPKMSIGLLLLTVSFSLSGVFSPYQSLRDSFFGFLVGLSYLLPYLFLCFLIDWEEFPKDYFAHLLTALGVLLSFELLAIYAVYHNEVMNNTFTPDFIRTGWGMKNNIGGMLALSLPGPLYLGLKKKWSPLYLLVNIFFFSMVALSESRASLLISMVAEIFLFATFLYCGKGKRISFLITIVSALLFFFFAFFLLHRLHPAFLENIVYTLKHLSFDNLSSGRMELWKLGWSYFKEYPFFGSGYYRLPYDYRLWYFATNFIPVRMHNTYLQILASSGLIGMVCYLYHRVESALLIFRRLSLEKWILFLFYFIYLGCSAVDCHFFNFGPALLYAVMAAIAEGEDILQRKENKEQYLKDLKDYLS